MNLPLRSLLAYRLHIVCTMTPYNGARTKVQLKLTIQRCKMLQEKKVIMESFRQSLSHRTLPLFLADLRLFKPSPHC